MKKKISLLLAILICCTIFVTAVSCNSTNKITKMEEKLNKADSYKIEITMDNIPMFGKATMTMKIEGNKTFTSGMFGESDIFTEEVNGKTYQYFEVDDVWYKEEIKEEKDDEEESIFSDDFIESLFDAEKYEAVKGEKNTFVLKEGEEIDGISDVKVVVEKDALTILGVVEGFDVSFVFDGINKTKVNLPKDAIEL